MKKIPTLFIRDPLAAGPPRVSREPQLLAIIDRLTKTHAAGG